MHNDNASIERPKVALLVSRRLQHTVLSESAYEQLAAVATVVVPTGTTIEVSEVPALLREAVACFTCWGTPLLNDAVLDQARSLRLIAHSAGTLRHLVKPTVFARGIRVTHSNSALAEGVAEYTVMQMLNSLRRTDQQDRALKNGEEWPQPAGRLLRAQTVGLASIGAIGRGVIERLKPFGCRLLAYDPYLTPEESTQLGVEQVELDELFERSDIVSLHTPLLPTTTGMIGTKQLARLREGSILINTARAGIVEEDALMRELETGRFTAVLDVFYKEPLPLDHRLRSLPNVIITPHSAAMTSETYLLQGQMMVDEILRFLRGEPLHHEIDPERIAIMA